MIGYEKLLFLCILFTLWTNGYAQHSSGEFARVVVIQPKPGASADFTAGYERHIAWHRNNNDPWSWYGWFFVLGDRLGQFMDGTFNHALADFDKSILPVEDAADNQKNVVPHADFISHTIYERLPHLSHGPSLPDTSPYLALYTFVVTPGNEQKFESSLKGLSPGRMSVFKLRIGGPMTQYLLMRAATSFSSGASLPEIKLPAAIVRDAKSELLRFQSTMSYFP